MFCPEYTCYFNRTRNLSYGRRIHPLLLANVSNIESKNLLRPKDTELSASYKPLSIPANTKFSSTQHVNKNNKNF